MQFLTRIFAALLMFAVAPPPAFAQGAPDPGQQTGPDSTVVPPPPPAPAPPPPETAKPPAPPPAAPTAKKGPVDRLKPGQYIWEKRAYDATNLRIIAVLDIQRLYVFDGDVLVGLSTISTGKKGHPTPVGTFEILQKNIDHKSNLYSNAPMPYMQRLTWDGIALHAGHIPGYPASHGCLRLPLPFAKALYSVTRMKQPVTILASLDTPKAEPVPEPAPVPEAVLPPNTVPEPKAPSEPVPAPEPKLEVEPLPGAPA